MINTYTLSNVEQGIKNFLQIHYEPIDDMYSYVILGCKNRTFYNTLDTSGIRNFQYVKTTEIGEENKVIQNLTESMDRKTDYYITPNGFTTPMKRDLNHVFTFHNIVIDIDCHINRMTKKEKNYVIDACYFFLTHDLFSEIDFPTPNTIVNTGRGLQLWWAINPISYKLKYAYNGVRKYLMNRIEETIKGIETLQTINVDRAASQNYAGYFRMPGSYNSKSQNYSTFEILHEDRLDVIENYYVDNPQERRKKKKEDKIKKSKKRVIARKNNLISTREEMLYDLLDLRNGISEGYRDYMLLILYNTYLSAGKSENEAIFAIESLNDKFEKPLTDKELKNYMSTSTRKKYKYSNKKIIEILDLTEEEQDILNFHIKTKSNKETIMEVKRNNKTERDNQILMLNSQGHAQQDIAKFVGCSQATVSRVINKGKKKEEEKNIA